MEHGTVAAFPSLEVNRTTSTTSRPAKLGRPGEAASLSIPLVRSCLWNLYRLKRILIRWFVCAVQVPSGTDGDAPALFVVGELIDSTGGLRSSSATTFMSLERERP